MAKPKGSAKTGGRKAGTPNKSTASMREWITQIINTNQAELATAFQTLEPKQKWDVAEKLLGYIVPKQQAVSNKIAFEELSEEELDLIISGLNNNIHDDN